MESSWIFRVQTVAHLDTCSPSKWKSGHLLTCEFLMILILLLGWILPIIRELKFRDYFIWLWPLFFECFTKPLTTAETRCWEIKLAFILFIIIFPLTHLRLTFFFFKLFISTFKIHNFNESKHILNVEKEDAWT